MVCVQVQPRRLNTVYMYLVLRRATQAGAYPFDRVLRSRLSSPRRQNKIHNNLRVHAVVRASCRRQGNTATRSLLPLSTQASSVPSPQMFHTHVRLSHSRAGNGSRHGRQGVRTHGPSCAHYGALLLDLSPPELGQDRFRSRQPPCESVLCPLCSLPYACAVCALDAFSCHFVHHSISEYICLCLRDTPPESCRTSLIGFALQGCGNNSQPMSVQLREGLIVSVW